jgi:hypothetical protein
MGYCNRFTCASVFALLSFSVGGIAGPAAADEEEGPNRGRVSVSIGSDITSAYFFRGILNERDGFIWQPYGDLNVNLYSGDGFIRSVDAAFGAWASFQSEKTLATHDGPSNLYEVDYYPYLTVGLPYGLETSLSYILYTSPNGAFSTVQQLDWGIGLDDSEWLGPFALNPAILFSFELENTSFGDDEGGYFEFSLEPGFAVDLSDDYALSFGVPLALGLSMYDYYETTSGDHTFGFFSFGLNASIPLAFIPEDFGSWSTGVGINVLVLSDVLEDANEGDSPFPVGTWNVSMEY